MEKQNEEKRLLKEKKELLKQAAENVRMGNREKAKGEHIDFRKL